MKNATTMSGTTSRMARGIEFLHELRSQQLATKSSLFETANGTLETSLTPRGTIKVEVFDRRSNYIRLDLTSHGLDTLINSLKGLRTQNAN